MVGNTATIGRRLRHELEQFALLTAYLYVCFGALLLYKTAILNGAGISYAPYGLAIVKALILAKFIMLGQMAHIGDRYDRRRFIYVIIHKSILFLILLNILSAAEEAIVGLFHGRTLGASLAEVGGSALQFLATSVIMLLILIPYITLKELESVLGEGGVWQLLRQQQTGHRSG